MPAHFLCLSASFRSALLLFQQKLSAKKVLSSTPKKEYVERNFFRNYGLSLEALRPLFGTRGVAHPKPEPRESDYHTDRVERRNFPLAEPAGVFLDVVLLC